MKAVVWKDINRLEYTDVPDPVCQPGWVKIKVMAVGLCSTEVHMITGKFEAGKPPHILGHEICGQIVELGEGCDQKWLHQRVVVETYVGCGKCEFCQSGRKHLCPAGEIGYPPYNGGDAQFVCVPEGCVRAIPDNVSYDEGAIMEAVACPFGAVLNSGLKMGQTVLVLGAGVAGLAFIQSARAAGAGKVLCAVRNDLKAEMATKAGADIVDLRKEDLYERVMAETNGMGVDLAIEAAGVPQTVKQAFQCVKSDGTVLLYGIPDKAADIPLPVTECILRQIHVVGYTGNQFGWDPLIQLVSNGTINIKDMISKVVPLSQMADAVELLETQGSKLIKIVMHPWDE